MDLAAIEGGRVRAAHGWIKPPMLRASCSRTGSGVPAAGVGELAPSTGGCAGANRVQSQIM